MASNHPIDQLFREGLGSSEMKPSAAAWEQVQQKTQKKNRIPFLQVAASVALICAVGVTLWLTLSKESKELSQGESIEVLFPEQLAYYPIIIPEREIMIELFPEAIPTTDDSLLPQLEQTLASESKYIVMDIPTISVEARGSTALVEGMIDVPQLDIEQPVDNKVNIFYYTQATPEELDASKGKLAKIIDYAKTTNPVDWVGDFRNKKDEWIENVFSLDE